MKSYLHLLFLAFIVVVQIQNIAARAERSFIAVKPDGVGRGLVGEVITRFSRKGYRMTGGKLIHPSLENTERHYVEHKERSFYPSLLDYFTSGPVFAMVWEGESVVKGGRQLIGKTNPLEAQLGTIRGDFATSIEHNIVHGSATVDDAEREIAIWFDASEIHTASSPSDVCDL